MVFLKQKLYFCFSHLVFHLNSHYSLFGHTRLRLSVHMYKSQLDCSADAWSFQQSCTYVYPTGLPRACEEFCCLCGHEGILFSEGAPFKLQITKEGAAQNTELSTLKVIFLLYLTPEWNRFPWFFLPPCFCCRALDLQMRCLRKVYSSKILQSCIPNSVFLLQVYFYICTCAHAFSS